MADSGDAVPDKYRGFLKAIKDDSTNTKALVIRSTYILIQYEKNREATARTNRDN